MSAAAEAPGFVPARTLPNGGYVYSPLGIFEFQADGVAEAYVRTQEDGQSGVLAVWDTGIGKGQEIHEPVLTPGGWVPIGGIRPGDQVMGSDGLPTCVTSVHPQGVRPLYRVTFSDGASVVCDENHLWTVRYWGSDRSSGKQVRVRREAVLSVTELIEKGIKTPAGRRKFAIPMTQPVQYTPRVLPIPAYQLGVLLGDGSIRSDGTVTLSTDKEIIEEFGVSGEPRYRRGCFYKTTSMYATELIAMRLAGKQSHEKFVPREYLHAPEADRRALLAGLLDTDGSPIEDGGVEFTSTAEALVDAVAELTESLGGISRNKTSRVTRYTYGGETREGRESWRINIKLNDQPFRLARKMIRWQRPTKYEVGRWFESIERIEDGESVCIKVEAADELYLTRHHIVTHNTWLAMALAAYLFEDDQIDAVMVLAEKGKIRDWLRDFERATAMSAHLYHGTGRQKRLAKAGTPHVFITTYETGRNELVVKGRDPGKRSITRHDGPLMGTLGLRGKRILWVFDEITAKLRTRSSESHQAYAYVLNQLRKSPMHQRVLGLTGTPIERDMADSYNIGRIVCPESMPTVEQFEKTFTKGKDPYGHYEFRAGTKHAFAHLFQDIVMRKSKRDQDVIDQFPKQVEEAWHVPLTPDHAKLYDAVATLLDPEDGEELTPQLARRNSERLWNAVRMTAGHPASHLHANNEISRMIVDAVGEEGLRAIASSKSDELISRLKPIIKGQGAQVVIFTFYGHTVLKELGKDLRKAGYTVGEFHGGKTAHANDDAQEQFKRGNSEILLCSDAAARGLNLGNAEYVIEYESAITYANRVQRINRAHRIDSDHPLVTCITMIAEDTIEEPIADRTMERNKDHDLLVGDDEDGSNIITAEQRRQMLAIKKRRR